MLKAPDFWRGSDGLIYFEKPKDKDSLDITSERLIALLCEALDKIDFETISMNLGDDLELTYRLKFEKIYDSIVLLKSMS